MSFFKLKGKEQISVVECQLHFFHRKGKAPKKEYEQNNFALFVNSGKVVMTAHATKQKHLGQSIEEVEKEYFKDFYKEII